MLVLKAAADQTREEYIKSEQGFCVRSYVRSGIHSQGLIFPIDEFPEISMPYQKCIDEAGQDQVAIEKATEEL